MLRHSLSVPTRGLGDMGFAIDRRSVTIALALVQSRVCSRFAGQAAKMCAALDLGAGAHARAKWAGQALQQIKEHVVVVMGQTMSPITGSHNCTEPEASAALERLRKLLADEIICSGLLEHWARLLLLAASACPKSDASLQTRLEVGWGGMCIICKLFYENCGDALCLLLPSSPCLSYFIACQTISACADLNEGGETYGMPPADRRPPPPPTAVEVAERHETLLSWLAVWADTVVLERCRLAAAVTGAAADGSAPVATGRLQTLYRRELSRLEQRQAELEPEAGPSDVAALADEVMAARQRLELSAGAPPLNTAAGFEVCMRLAEAEAASGGAAAARQLEGAAARRPPGARPGALSRVESLQLALRSLRCARVMLAGKSVLQLPSLSPALCSRLGRLWRATVATATAVLTTPVADSDQLAAAHQVRQQTGSLLATLSVPDGPASPPGPDMAAALAAGYLPCLTAYLRAAWRPGDGAGALVDVSHLELKAAVSAQLLTYGEAREALSLVAALADLLREHAAAIASSGPAAAAAGRPATPRADWVLKTASVTKHASDTAVLVLASHRSGRAIPVVVSALVAVVLPEAARVLLELRPLARGSDDKYGIEGSLASLLSVVPLLAAAAARAAGSGSEGDSGREAAGGNSGNVGGVGRGDGGSAGVGGSVASGTVGSTSGSGVGAADGDVASWRQLLLVELRLPALLGAAMEQLDGASHAAGARSDGGDGAAERTTALDLVTARALAALAAWAPGELARMVAAADRTAAAGRGRGGTPPTTALLRSVLGPGAAVPRPKLLEAVEAACGGAGLRDPAQLCNEPWGPWWSSAGTLLPPTRARVLLASG
ncbi:hypothetical protein GPECTOR_417g273 [Gonium pectorale]|uniref:Uncharacterized protein n=1 Tax=Gonium pectorale TaxID=33097 RepID=A0A150FV94_GONPE|nr:hypothetical protein GPECTOR_417g273 [Gonium pectorale]|eukprot:KXZ41519.1 hypothetical protein GPECTOR_417g273 [Gonium pectorale]